MKAGGDEGSEAESGGGGGCEQRRRRRRRRRGDTPVATNPPAPCRPAAVWLQPRAWSLTRAVVKGSSECCVSSGLEESRGEQ